MKQSAIAQAEFNLRDGGKMMFELFKPHFDKKKQAWGCKFIFSAPLDTERVIFGENSLQSVVLALKVAATSLYASELYKDKQIGVFGEFGGPLVLPAPHTLLDVAPYPF